MTPQDAKPFFEIMGLVYERYRGKPASDELLMLDFKVLAPYSLQQVVSAIEGHLADPVAGKWLPNPGELIQRITGTMPTAAQVVALARNADTPAGCFSLQIIGAWDLKSQSAFYLAQRAEEVIAKLPDFVARARAGEYTAAELELMRDKGVDPGGHLAPGLPGPCDETAKLIRTKALASPDQGDRSAQLELVYSDQRRASA